LIHGPVRVLTDHSNLQYMKNTCNNRVLRWGIIQIADFLSRAIPPQERESRVLVITAANESGNEDLQALWKFVDSLPEGANENRVIQLDQKPDPTVLSSIWVLAHEDPLAGHSGMKRTLKRIQTAINWPGMEEDISRMVRECPTCQKLRAHQPEPATLASTRARGPLESVFIDCCFNQCKDCSHSVL